MAPSAHELLISQGSSDSKPPLHTICGIFNKTTRTLSELTLSYVQFFSLLPKKIKFLLTASELQAEHMVSIPHSLVYELHKYLVEGWRKLHLSAASLAASFSLELIRFLRASSTSPRPAVSQSIWCCNTVGLLWPHFPRCICGSGLSRELIGWEDCGIDQPSPGVRSARCGSGVCPQHTPLIFGLSSNPPINPLFSVVTFGFSGQGILFCHVLFFRRRQQHAFAVPLSIFFFTLVSDRSISPHAWNYAQLDLEKPWHVISTVSSYKKDAPI